MSSSFCSFRLLAEHFRVLVVSDKTLDCENRFCTPAQYCTIRKDTIVQNKTTGGS